jgi:hypothetical protein
VSDKPRDGFQRFDSQLEVRVYQHLIQIGEIPLIHHPLGLLGNEIWKVDFYLPLRKTAIEVKGKWIKESDSQQQRLLVLQCLILENSGIQVLMVSDCDFSIRNREVIDYHGLHFE